MKLHKKIKKSTKQFITVAIICVVVIGSIFGLMTIFIYSNTKDNYERIVEQQKNEIAANKKFVYVANKDINAGEVIKREYVQKQEVFSSMPDNLYINDCIGKSSLIDIPEGTQIVSVMCSENIVSSDLREVEYEVIHINLNITSNDFVDVRIFYPNGESYVILTKKSLKDYEPGNIICYLWNDELEIQRMNAAIVDASLYSGAKIYVTKYIEPSIQNASNVTYVPNIAVLQLIEDNPNIIYKASQLLNIELRKELENRLTDSFNKDINNVNWELSDFKIEFPKENISNQTSEQTSNQTSSQTSNQTSSQTSEQIPKNSEINNIISNNYNDTINYLDPEKG